MQISENFKLSEFTNSKTADKKKIDNTPSPSERANIYTLVNEILQPIRSKFGKSIKVNSGFRCKNLNKAVFGSSTSQHLTGSAADITTYDSNNNIIMQHEMSTLKRTETGTPQYEVRENRRNNIDFTQTITDKLS